MISAADPRRSARLGSGQGEDEAAPIYSHRDGLPQTQNHADRTSSPLSAAGRDGTERAAPGNPTGAATKARTPGAPAGQPRTGPWSRARGGRAAPELSWPPPHLGALSGAGRPQQHRADPPADFRARRLPAAAPRLRARSHGRHRLRLAGSRGHVVGGATRVVGGVAGTVGGATRTGPCAGNGGPLCGRGGRRRAERAGCELPARGFPYAGTKAAPGGTRVRRCWATA